MVLVSSDRKQLRLVFLKECMVNKCLKLSASGLSLALPEEIHPESEGQGSSPSLMLASQPLLQLRADSRTKDQPNGEHFFRALCQARDAARLEEMDFSGSPGHLFLMHPGVRLRLKSFCTYTRAFPWGARHLPISGDPSDPVSPLSRCSVGSWGCLSSSWVTGGVSPSRREANIQPH